VVGGGHLPAEPVEHAQRDDSALGSRSHTAPAPVATGFGNGPSNQLVAPVTGAGSAATGGV
jgi:hypothetical protein